MPVDVQEKPAIASSDRKEISFLTESLKKEGGDIVSYRKLDNYFDNLPEEISRLEKAVAEKFPRYPQDKLKMMLNLIFGVSRQRREVINQVDFVTKEDKSISATVQGCYVHQIFNASRPDVDPGYTEAVFQMAGNTVSLAERFQKVRGNNLSNWWNGVKYELAVIRALRNKDYQVFLPNYAKGEEVLEFDVRRGVDIMVKTPEKDIVLLDVKGRLNREDRPDQILHEIILKSRRSVDLSKSVDSVREAIQEIQANPKVCRGTLIIPTHKDFFEDPPIWGESEKDNTSRRKYFNKLSCLKKPCESEIITLLESIVLQRPKLPVLEL